MSCSELEVVVVVDKVVEGLVEEATDVCDVVVGVVVVVVLVEVVVLCEVDESELYAYKPTPAIIKITITTTTATTRLIADRGSFRDIRMLSSFLCSLIKCF